MPENGAYDPIPVTPEMDFEGWSPPRHPLPTLTPWEAMSERVFALVDCSSFYCGAGIRSVAQAAPCTHRTSRSTPICRGRCRRCSAPSPMRSRTTALTRSSSGSPACRGMISRRLPRRSVDGCTGGRGSRSGAGSERRKPQPRSPMNWLNGGTGATSCSLAAPKRSGTHFGAGAGLRGLGRWPRLHESFWRLGDSWHHQCAAAKRAAGRVGEEADDGGRPTRGPRTARHLLPTLGGGDSHAEEPRPQSDVQAPGHGARGAGVEAVSLATPHARRRSCERRG